jgi:hypothetical protein
VQPKAWNVHVAGSVAAVQQRENIPQFLHVLGRDAPRRPSIVECFQAPMPERSNQRCKVMRRLSPVN